MIWIKFYKIYIHTYNPESKFLLKNSMSSTSVTSSDPHNSAVHPPVSSKVFDFMDEIKIWMDQNNELWDQAVDDVDQTQETLQQAIEQFYQDHTEPEPDSE